MDGSKYMYVEGRYLNSDGKALGEATTGIKIPIFRGAKRIQHLPAYPLQYHAEKETVRRELIRCGRDFVSLMTATVEFAVVNIRAIEWSQSSFDNVKIPEAQKRPILGLTATDLGRKPENTLTDLVPGKGQGINFLL